MRRRPGFWALFSLNLLLVALGGYLLNLFQRERGATESLQRGLSSLRQELALERARASDREYALENMGRLLADVRQTPGEADNAVGDEESPEPREPIDSGDDVNLLLAQLSSLASRPDLDGLGRLSPDELSELKSKWENLDVGVKRASVALEGGVDVDTVLSDPTWNPTDRELSLEERVELAVELRNLKFFARTLPIEALHSIVLPQADARRAVGDYVEYKGAPPPLPEGVILSHAEATDVEGVSRIYHFYENENEDLYHKWYVEKEQSLKSKVAIYEIINGSIEAHQ